MGEEPAEVVAPRPRSRRYLKILHEDLIVSEGWKKLTPLQQGEALRMLLLHALEGKVPERWKRTAQLRETGIAPKKSYVRPPPTRYAAFTESWMRAWEQMRGEKYIWDSKQRAGIRSAFEKANGDLLLFESRVRLLFGHKNPWYQQMASPSLVAAHWNELAGGPKTAKVQPPPMFSAVPKVVCAYCGHYAEAEGQCMACRRNWKPAAAMGR